MTEDHRLLNGRQSQREINFLEACSECDEDELLNIMQSNPSPEQINQQDASGKTGLCHACMSGFTNIVQLLQDLPGLDVNLGDSEGNTPLIFAAQAGHNEVVNLLLHGFKGIDKDKCNNAGFTALIKAAIQGRLRCAKSLIFAGLCAEEWADFCGRHECAAGINKFHHSKKYFLTKLKRKCTSAWKSEGSFTQPRSPHPLQKKKAIEHTKSLDCIDDKPVPMLTVTENIGDEETMLDIPT